MAEKTIARDANSPVETGRESTRENEKFVRPPVDIYETAEGLVVVADLPGVPRDGLSVDVQNGVLTIQGRVKDEPSRSASYQEFELYSYFRQFELSDTVDVTRITAELKNGVLTLQLPKAEEALPKRISVTVG